jgi:hypothetical protein
MRQIHPLPPPAGDTGSKRISCQQGIQTFYNPNSDLLAIERMMKSVVQFHLQYQNFFLQTFNFILQGQNSIAISL